MKTKLFVACEIQYFELGIFSFNSYVYYISRDFIASTRTFNLPNRTFSFSTRVFNLPTRAFNLLTRAFNLATRAFSVLTRGLELVPRGFELVTYRFELVTRRFELVIRGLELVTRNSCFTFPRINGVSVGNSVYDSSQFPFSRAKTRGKVQDRLQVKFILCKIDNL